MATKQELLNKLKGCLESWADDQKNLKKVKDVQAAMQQCFDQGISLEDGVHQVADEFGWYEGVTW